MFLSCQPFITFPLFFFSIGQESLPPTNLPPLHLHKTPQNRHFSSAAQLLEQRKPRDLGGFGGISTATLSRRPSQECLLSLGLGHGQVCGLRVSPRRGRERGREIEAQHFVKRFFPPPSEEQKAAFCSCSGRTSRGCLDARTLPPAFSQVVTTTLLLRLPR